MILTYTTEIQKWLDGNTVNNTDINQKQQTQMLMFLI